MDQGYVTALGTPIDSTGGLVEKSFQKQIDDQIDANAQALLALGTMGNEAYLRDRAFTQAAKVAAEATGGRVPLFIGVMDNSVARVLDRIDAIADIPCDGVVSTTPFYLPPSREEMKTFYLRIADASEKPVYMYDLPPVTQAAIPPDLVLELATHPNIHGIKSGRLETCRIVEFSDKRPADFLVMYSGLDTFDVAWSYGLTHQLDGMFSCTPDLSRRLYDALGSGEIETGRSLLDKILLLRNVFVGMGVFKGFTAAMNLLGYEGHWGPDFVSPADERENGTVRDTLNHIGLI